MNNNEGWHLDKRVPVGLILAGVLQLAGVVWLWATLESRVAVNELAVQRLENRTEVLRVAGQEQAIQFARFEEQIIGLRSDIERLVSAIEKDARQ